MGAAAKRAAWILWMVAYSTALVVLGFALIGGGAIFALVGIQAVLEGADAGHVIAGLLFAVSGVAAFIGGIVLLYRLAGNGARGRRGRGHAGYVGSGWYGSDGGGGSSGGSCGWFGGDGGGGGGGFGGGDGGGGGC